MAFLLPPGFSELQGVKGVISGSEIVLDVFVWLLLFPPGGPRSPGHGLQLGLPAGGRLGSG